MSKLDPDLFLTTPDERLRIKNRTKQLIKLAGGPEIFQHSVGVPNDMLSKYGSISEPNFINASVIIALDRQLGAPMMLEELANMLGFHLVPLEPAPPAAIGIADLAHAHKETSEAVGAVAQLVAGQDSLAARRAALKEIDESIGALHKVRRKVAA